MTETKITPKIGWKTFILITCIAGPIVVAVTRQIWLDRVLSPDLAGVVNALVGLLGVALGLFGYSKYQTGRRAVHMATATRILNGHDDQPPDDLTDEDV